jgi:hypothetical protein
LLEGSRVKQILLRNENLKQMCCRNDLSYTAASCLTENRTSKQIVVDPGGAHPARALLPPLKLEKIRFFGV